MSRKINKMFSEVHRSYDRANHIYSMGVDILWRRSAAKEATLPQKRYKILDIATGAGEFAIDVANEASKKNKKVKITGIDFNRDMLELGKERLARLGIKNISLRLGDALSISLKPESFDLATSAFAIRNFDSIEVFAVQLYRILKKGGRFVILEMGNPEKGPQRIFFKYYFGKLMRPLGYLINKDAHAWLFYSITNFDRRKLAETLSRTGFKKIKVRSLFTGVGFIITGEK